MDSTIRCNVHNQFLIVCTLLNAGILNSILHVFDGRIDRVDWNKSKWSVLHLVLISRHITATFTYSKLDVELCSRIECADDQIWIHDLERACSFADHARGEFTPSFDRKGYFF